MNTLVKNNGGGLVSTNIVSICHFFVLKISTKPNTNHINGLLTQVRLLVARHASRPSQASEQTGTMQGGPPPYDRFERSDMGPTKTWPKINVVVNGSFFTPTIMKWNYGPLLYNR